MATGSDDISAKIAHIEAMRPMIGDEAADAAIAALHPQHASSSATTSQQQRAGGNITNSPQTVQQDDSTHGTAITHDNYGQNIGVNLGRVTLFSGGTTSSNIADVINIYQQATETPDVDYGAALRRYLEHLYRQHATIDLRGIDDRPLDMPLRELYISLSLHEPQADDLRGRGALRSFMEWARSLAGLKDDASRVEWPYVLHFSQLAVVGTPGSGKTTLLQYTTLRLAEILARDTNDQLAALGLDDDGSRPPVPLLLPLRELGAYLSESNGRETMAANPRLLLDCLQHFYNGFGLDLPDDFFIRLCDTGRAMLLLDGLDEVTRTDDRAFVSAIVRECATRYDACRYVVTARVAAYQGDAQIGAGFRICTVADMSAQQQQQFILNWSRSVQRMLYQFQGDDLKRATTRYANELWQALQMNERVRDLATNPLLLTVVAVIYHNNYVLPEDRAALYEECIEVLLRGGRGKADRAAQTRRQYSGKPELSMGLHPRRELLSAVAYTMHQRGEQGRIIERQDLIRTVATRLPTRPDADEAARAFVAELPVHIGLLDEVQPDRFRFSHLSFQEFLAARHIAETDQWDELLAHYRENWWREVILLCAGHLSQARCWRFLGKLIKQGQTSSDRAEALGLATDAIAELERFKGQGPLNKQIIRQAWGILEAQPAPAVPAVARVECGRVLARLGDPRRAVNDLPPEMVQIAGGTFVIGNTKEAARDDDEVNDLPLTVPTFKIARYPVTNAQWKLFLDDDGYNPDAPWWDAAGQAWLRKSDRLKTLSRYDKHLGIALPNHPVVTITWYEAMAFCRWLSQHQGYNPHGNQYTLPSEAEWEYAARRATCRIYPWGNDQPDAKHANFARTYNGTTTPGCFPVGTTVEDGIHDLTGNVWEWTRSIYRPYPYNPGDGREDISKPSINEWVMRGSGWRDLGWAVSFQNQLNPLKFQWNRLFVLRASKRLYKSPDSYGSDVGVRLVQLVLDT